MEMGMHRFAAIGAGILLIVGFTGAASAADLPAATYTKAPVVVSPAYNWTGFYIGVNGGGGWGRSDYQYNGAPTNSDHDTTGGFAGGQVGYNWQMAAWVFGLEADGDWANISGSAPCRNPVFTCGTNTRDLASFRGRVGYATNNVLFYGTGGAGYANNRYSALVNGLPAINSTGFFTDDRWGYAAGAGIELGFAPNWSAKVEYMHYGFSGDTAPVGTLSGLTSAALRLNIDTIKAGVNYRFNSGEPVVARY
jgi:outer membrane immunogenic protein